MFVAGTRNLKLETSLYFFYSLLLTFAICALSPLFLLGALRHGKYVAGLRQRLGAVPRVGVRGSAPVIWLHSVSVGETQAARPLVRALLERFPAYLFVVSTTTLTGQRRARELYGDEAAAIIYFPFDWAWSVRRALSRVNPSLVLVMETELWPRFLRECARRGVPIALVNGRISERSFRGYRRLGGFIRRVVNSLSLAIMQTDADAARLCALGLAPARIRVSGNVKFDAEVALDEQSVTDALRARFGFDGTRPLLVAASTHAPEEVIVLTAFRQLCTASTDDTRKPRLLLAPRHPERFADVAALVEHSGLTHARRTAPARAADQKSDVVLLDTIGELRAAYPLADVVFVGGSIAQTGGHNVLEPAAAAKCVVVGAHTFNFAAIVRDFRDQEALVQLSALDDAHAPAALARIVGELFIDDERRRLIGTRARAALEQSRGATARTIEMLTPLLPAQPDANLRSPLP